MIGRPLPPGTVAKLLINSAADERVFGNQFLSTATWSVLAFGPLLWQPSRRRARA